MLPPPAIFSLFSLVLLKHFKRQLGECKTTKELERPAVRKSIVMEFLGAVYRHNQGRQEQTPSPANLMVEMPGRAVTEKEMWDSLKE